MRDFLDQASNIALQGVAQVLKRRTVEVDSFPAPVEDSRCRADGWPVHQRECLPQPVRMGLHIIIDKGEIGTGSQLCGLVAGMGETPVRVVLDQMNSGKTLSHQGLRAVTAAVVDHEDLAAAGELQRREQFPEVGFPIPVDGHDADVRG